MHPHDPYQQHHQQYPPQQQPPVVYVQQPTSKAATMGIWAIFLWIAAPAILIVLCCVGCFVSGLASSFMHGVQNGVSATPSP